MTQTMRNRYVAHREAMRDIKSDARDYVVAVQASYMARNAKPISKLAAASVENGNVRVFYE